MAAATIAEIKRSYPEPVAEDALPEGVVVGMDADIPGSMNSALDGILSRFQKMFDSQAPKISGKMVAEADKASTSAVKSSLKEASSNVVVPTTVLQSGEIADVWKASVAENVDLIKSVPGQYMQRIKDQVQDGITKGRGIADLLPELQNIQGMSDRRAKLIAYDQTRKAYASYNLTKLTGAGVKKFEWLHSGGAAEPRKDHIAMSGNVYRFDDPPVIDQRTGERGFPGQAINCSCRMLPVVDEDDTAPVEQEAPQIEIQQTEAESHSAEIAAREVPSFIEKPTLREEQPQFHRDLPKVSQTSVTLFEDRNKQHIESRAKSLGMQEDEYRNKVDSAVKDVVGKSDIYVRVKPATLEKILDNGRFKSQFETDTSGGRVDKRSRSTTEKLLMGVDTDIDVTKRPIYGYMDDDPDGGMSKILSMDQYGKVAVKLKPHVRSKSTFTVGDSLDYTGAGREQRFIASPVNDPSHKSVMFDFGVADPLKRLEAGEIKDSVGYIEAQIHGGTSVDDIDEVIFNSPPKKDVQSKLSSLNIKWRVVKKEQV